MAYEVSRRSFLKGAAVLAVATAASGLLTGCGGGSDKDPDFTIGNYKVYFGNLDFGQSDAKGNHFIEPTLKIECMKTNIMHTSKKFSSVFSAKVGSTTLNLLNDDESIKKMTKGDKFQYAPHFVTTDDALYAKLKNGEETVKLTIDLYGDSATFEVNLKNNTIKYTVKG